MTDEEANRVWEAMKASPFRRLIEFEIMVRVQTETARLITMDALSQFAKQQGVVEGLVVALGILRRADRPLSTPNYTR